MSHQALARKWRPQRFDDVIGQRGVVETLKNAITTGRLAQAPAPATAAQTRATRETRERQVILVDTSVWVEHLRQANAVLSRELDAGRVLIHPFVIGELACGRLRNPREVLANPQHERTKAFLSKVL